MKIAVVGSGGREGALRNRFDSEDHDVVVAEGRAGIAGSTNTLPKNLRANLFVIGPEDPLVKGMADDLRAQGKQVFGPGKNDARLEGSKIWMKTLLDRAGVKTAPWKAFKQGQEGAAEAFIRSHWNKWVVKTDYLKAGKGVLVTDDIEEAIADARAKLEHGAIVIEQALEGVEVSFFAVCSGKTWALLPSARDYKRQLDGDEGPNTGGMGSFSPVAGSPSLEKLGAIIDPVLAQLEDYRGVLFGGLMITAEGIYVLEFNIRFGDPEIQSILPRLTIDLGELLADAAAGVQLDNTEVDAEGACVTVVLAAEGYPTNTHKGGEVISGIDDAERIDGVTVVHAGTEKLADGRFVTAGGRVLNVVGKGRTVKEARAKAYQGVSCISWPGMQYRGDIAA